MPTYEYECTKCGRIFEEFESITAKPKRTINTDCVRCNNKAPVRRLIGMGAGVLFKGSGFYQTDYRSESYKAGAKAEKSAAETSSGKDSSTDKKKTDSGKSSSAREKTTAKKSA
jgi:putative FmdB family regulatory protein